MSELENDTPWLLDWWWAGCCRRVKVSCCSGCPIIFLGSSSIVERATSMDIYTVIKSKLFCTLGHFFHWALRVQDLVFILLLREFIICVGFVCSSTHSWIISSSEVRWLFSSLNMISVFRIVKRCLSDNIIVVIMHIYIA